MGTEAAEAFVVPMGGKGSARLAGGLAPDLLAVHGVDFFGFTFKEGGFGGRDPKGNRQLLADVTQMIEGGQLSPAKPTTYPLARAGEALTALTERRIAGKVVLLPHGDEEKP